MISKSTANTAIHMSHVLPNLFLARIPRLEKQVHVASISYCIRPDTGTCAFTLVHVHLL